MAHQYDVHYTDDQGRSGQATVTTPHHHEDHPEPTWLRHICEVLEQIGVKVVSDGISRFVYRGRR
jgi:hypothetical protein